jgi:penicillin-binding protein 1A
MIRLIGYFFGIATTMALLVAGGAALYVSHLTKDLPDYEVLANYEPPVTTRVHASDGALMGEFARETPALPADSGHAGPRQGCVSVG